MAVALAGHMLDRGLPGKLVPVDVELPQLSRTLFGSPQACGWRACAGRVNAVEPDFGQGRVLVIWEVDDEVDLGLATGAERPKPGGALKAGGPPGPLG